MANNEPEGAADNPPPDCGPVRDFIDEDYRDQLSMESKCKQQPPEGAADLEQLAHETAWQYKESPLGLNKLSRLIHAALQRAADATDVNRLHWAGQIDKLTAQLAAAKEHNQDHWQAREILEKRCNELEDQLATAKELCPLCGHAWRRHDPEDGRCDAGPLCSCGRDLDWMQRKIAKLSHDAFLKDNGGQT